MNGDAMAEQVDDNASPPRSRRRVATIVLGVAAALVLTVSAIGAGLLLHIWNQRETFAFTPTNDSSARIVAVIGTDARPGPDASASERSGFGDRSTVKGARADVVLLVRFGGRTPPAVLNLPRDLVIDPGPSGRIGRLTNAWLPGPQSFADELCNSLGIGVDAMVVADPVALIRFVDALGGLDVTTDAPLRDRKSHLLPTAIGHQTLNGAQALAWIRSRHLEVLRAGRWVPVAGSGSASASIQRSERTNGVLSSLTSRMTHRPWAVRRAAASGMTGMRMSTSLSAIDFMNTVRVMGTTTIEDLHVRAIEGAVPAAMLTPASRGQLTAFSNGATCKVPPA